MKFFRFLFSGTLMGVLLVIFAIAIGYATFIENDFDATTAKMLIYNARWFEILLILMIVNFTGMIFTRQLYRKSKVNILMIHLALVIIIIGAGITRYIGFEGQMHIREGQTTDKYLSMDTYFDAYLEKGDAKVNESKRVWLSPVNKDIFNKELTLEGIDFQVAVEQYLPNAARRIVDDSNGAPIVALLAVGPQGRQERYLRWGEKAVLNGTGISFGDTINESSLRFTFIDGQLMMKPSRLDMPMISEDSGIEYKFMPVATMKLLQFPNMNLMVKEYKQKGSIRYVNVGAEEQGQKIMLVNVSGNNETKDVLLNYNRWNQIKMGDFVVSLKFGNQTWQLPFSIKLNDFELERYPGSMSPSSFASEVTVVDEEDGVNLPYRIFMNNILTYEGYRFYQSSYDQDEKGTILSVNHDRMGTIVTYIGYFLLFATLLISFFTKKTRFRRVSQQLKEVHEKRKKLYSAMLIFLLSSVGFTAYGQNEYIVQKKHASDFGKLIVQKNDGRMIPTNTIANEVLIKIYKKNNYEDQSADQVFLGMIVNRSYWQKQPMIKVGDEALQNMLGIDGNYASFLDFFTAQGEYKLKESVDKAYAKKPALRNMFDKELIYVDERVNVGFMAYNGSLLKILPVSNDPNNHWESPLDMHDHGKTQSGNRGVQLFENYISKLQAAMKSGDYSEADQALQQLKEFQIQEGAPSIMPSMTKIKLEVLYNNINIFKTLFPVYLMMGVILFGFLFAQIFKPSLEFKLIIKILVGILIIAFAAQTFGLALRWYISGHAPWSNRYESMIYIAWATMLAGFIFMKRAPIILSVTALLTGVTLLTAHMSWLNPEITNLVPVLKSYWLTIHVATITASYGVFGLAFLTGFLNLCIMIFRNQTNKERINLTLRELTLIIELALAIGLVLMVIGNFLGGVWANESWGRYWGWDPKETWSLVTIIFYTFVLHMRLIPGFRSTFTFNFLAMFGISTVLMTYFGVNYYLSGLHSYASGDPVPIPSFVYYSIAVMLLISVLAAINDMRLKDQTPMMEGVE
jgi:cytochrome c-type biogenesis protein CcsB